jgi:hypothetical protein
VARLSYHDPPFSLEERVMQLGSKKSLTCSALLLAISLVMSGSGAAVAQAKADTGAGPTSIQSPQDLIQWMTYYYMHPQPDLLAPALIYADANGLVEKGEAPLTAFVSRVFAQNPKRVGPWAEQLNAALSPKSKPMLWSALWWSNTVEGKEQLNKLAQSLPAKSQDMILAQMAKPAVPIETMEMKSPEVLDELWGAFSATGDEKYVSRLMGALPWIYDPSGDFNKLSIGGAARWSLTSNAQQHPKVMKLCVKARETRPELRKALDQVLADAAKAQQQASTRSTQ